MRRLWWLASGLGFFSACFAVAWAALPSPHSCRSIWCGYDFDLAAAVDFVRGNFTAAQMLLMLVGIAGAIFAVSMAASPRRRHLVAGLAIAISFAVVAYTLPRRVVPQPCDDSGHFLAGACADIVSSQVLLRLAILGVGLLVGAAIAGRDWWRRRGTLPDPLAGLVRVDL
jgi:hypothetical protein